jgi:hypothetical protein
MQLPVATIISDLALAITSLAYDTTSFSTWSAENSTRNTSVQS